MSVRGRLAAVGAVAVSLGVFGGFFFDSYRIFAPLFVIGFLILVVLFFTGDADG